MERRDFIRACAYSGISAALPSTAQGAISRAYKRARLVDPGGRPLKARALAVDRNYIFHYPFAATPCFLLNLGKRTRSNSNLSTADARRYQWAGGTGPQRSIVAYSAICTHRLSYPTREISFISYRAEATPHSRQTQIIHCCSEHSRYDPSDGARVVGGPAPQPLAAILLDYDAAEDELYAVGTLGGEMFDEFFSRFAFRLATDHGGTARRDVEDSCVVTDLTQYCRQQVKC